LFEWLAGDVVIVLLCVRLAGWLAGCLFNTDSSALVVKQFAIICLSSEHFKVKGASFILLHGWRRHTKTTLTYVQYRLTV